jgi:hypothetical protein
MQPCSQYESVLRQNNQQRPVTFQVTKYNFLRFLSWGNLKGKVYKNNPRSIEALQTEITRVNGSIVVDELQKVSHNLFMQGEACLQAEGGHFRHLL